MSDAHAANRREDLRLITGRGRYTADWNLRGAACRFCAPTAFTSRLFRLMPQPLLRVPASWLSLLVLTRSPPATRNFPALLTFRPQRRRTAEARSPGAGDREGLLCGGSHRDGGRGVGTGGAGRARRHRRSNIAICVRWSRWKMRSRRGRRNCTPTCRATCA